MLRCPIIYVLVLQLLGLSLRGILVEQHFVEPIAAALRLQDVQTASAPCPGNSAGRSGQDLAGHVRGHLPDMRSHQRARQSGDQETAEEDCSLALSARRDGMESGNPKIGLQRHSRPVSNHLAQDLEEIPEDELVKKPQ